MEYYNGKGKFTEVGDKVLGWHSNRFPGPTKGFHSTLYSCNQKMLSPAAVSRSYRQFTYSGDTCPIFGTA